MSGHSHWSTIKRKKGAADSERGKLFGKLSQAISVAAHGGTDPIINSKLRLAIEKAKGANMPKENIKRAIEKGAGSGEGDSWEEFRVEGYGPAGVAIMLQLVTDNRNRTLAEIRSLFQKSGGSLGEQGSAAYVFGNDPENPSFTVPVQEKKEVQKVLELVNALDEHADVQEVWSNFELTNNPNVHKPA